VSRQTPYIAGVHRALIGHAQWSPASSGSQCPWPQLTLFLDPVSPNELRMWPATVQGCSVMAIPPPSRTLPAVIWAGFTGRLPNPHVLLGPILQNHIKIQVLCILMFYIYLWEGCQLPYVLLEN
jgi:hypothetical protein